MSGRAGAPDRRPLGGAGPAQDEVRNFRMPVLMVETGGHHARVRSLVWQDDVTLLSGGEDKVVKVWDFHEDPRLARSIRPMISRGPAGRSTRWPSRPGPMPGPVVPGCRRIRDRGPGRRHHGVSHPGPGPHAHGRGRDRMMPPPDGQPQAIGHTDVVTCLALTRPAASWPRAAPTPRSSSGMSRPSGRAPCCEGIAAGPRDRLQSRRHAAWRRAAPTARCGSGTSPRVRVAARAGNANRAQPDQHPGVQPRRPVDRRRPRIAGGSSRSRPGTWRQATRVRLPTDAGQGPVECVAFHTDARLPRLAVSIKSDASQVPDAMRMSCDVEIRDMPGGNVVHRRRVPGLVHALAFSPDGRRLAYAGGHDQAIQIVGSGRAGTAPARDQGRGEHAVRRPFRGRQQGRRLHPRGVRPRQSPRVVPGVRPGAASGADHRAGTSCPTGRSCNSRDGTSSPSTDPPAVGGGQRQQRPDPRASRSTGGWSPGVVVDVHPRRASHPRATVAIGTEAGVAVFDFETGTRTRVYAGHSSPVVSLAPSPDGRWLASGSMDQTVLLYPLDGCDTRAPWASPSGRGPTAPYVVESADRRSFAAAMGLLAGDVLLDVGIAGGTDGIKHYTTPAEMDEFFRLLPSRGALPVQDRHQGPPDDAGPAHRAAHVRGRAADDPAQQPGPGPVPGDGPRVGALDAPGLL